MHVSAMTSTPMPPITTVIERSVQMMKERMKKREKNSSVMRHCNKLLRAGRVLLLFDLIFCK